MQSEPKTDNITLPHDALFEELANKDYGRLEAAGHTYLDYTGGNIYAQSQIDAHFELLSKNVFGNPHSSNPTSSFATKLVNETRQKVLDFFNAEDYFCVFTQNASGALKIIGEDYPFEDNGRFVLLSDNHNSVNGIREYCTNAGGSFEYAPLKYEDLRIDEKALNDLLTDKSDYKHKLFAFPAQSNVSGVQHNLEWVDRAQKLGWDVLLDAAAFVPTNRLDLKSVSPDFVTISFYKIFGYPTGLGCLLIRKDRFDVLNKRWFAGGTVTLASVRAPNHRLALNHERFENGTINYLDIPAIKIGLEHIEKVGLDRIHERVKSLADLLYAELLELKHSNGNPLIKLHGPETRKHVGGTIIMNFLTADGEVIHFDDIEEEANKQMISIRSGCFCNPGIDEVNNEVTAEDLNLFFTDRKNGDYNDMINFLHKMRGATRVSFGIASRKKDIETFVSFAKEFYDK